MRFSATALLTLPLLAAAAEGPFDQYKAQFQNFLSSFGAAQPEAADGQHVPSSPEAEVDPENKIHVLTLHNWKDTLYSPVKASATKPEEWWLLATGGNKTCFGHCQKVEQAFKEATKTLAKLPDGPHAALINCDDQPVLCNSWSATSGVLWVIQMLPEPAPIDIYLRRLNLTTTTSQTILDLHAQDLKDKTVFHHHEGYFHPFDGPLAKNHVAVPIGYFFWLLNVIPSWAMMLGVSFLSRSMMSRRMNKQQTRPANAGAAPAAPRGAPPGDARS